MYIFTVVTHAAVECDGATSPLIKATNSASLTTYGTAQPTAATFACSQDPRMFQNSASPTIAPLSDTSLPSCDSMSESPDATSSTDLLDSAMHEQPSVVATTSRTK